MVSSVCWHSDFPGSQMCFQSSLCIVQLEEMSAFWFVSLRPIFLAMHQVRLWILRICQYLILEGCSVMFVRWLNICEIHYSQVRQKKVHTSWNTTSGHHYYPCSYNISPLSFFPQKLNPISPSSAWLNSLQRRMETKDNEFYTNRNKISQNKQTAKL